MVAPLNLTLLRPDQLAIARRPEKIKVLTAGRRYGKTVLGGVIVMNTLIRHGKALWMAPTYKQARPLLRWALGICGGHPEFTINKQDKIIETRRGGMLAIYSGDSPDGARGEFFDVAVLDEASQLNEDIFWDIIWPTLGQRNGDAFIISTPRGQNWFYKMWLKGQREEDSVYSTQLPSTANPMPAIQEAARKAKTMVSDRSYRQEWLAEFIPEGSGVFRVNEEAHCIAVRQNAALPGHMYGIGVDLGKRIDASVFTVVDISTRQEVYQDHMEEIDYSLQVERLKALYLKFHPLLIVVEVNAPGDVFCELARAAGMPILEFQTNNATKTAIIEALSVAFENDAIAIENDVNLVAELRAFKSERLPSGLVRYSAPSGMHDDRVMSLALAWYTVTQQFEPASEVEYGEPFTFSNSDY
jgi:phage terminase large subunit-like protein